MNRVLWSAQLPPQNNNTPISPHCSRLTVNLLIDPVLVDEPKLLDRNRFKDGFDREDLDASLGCQLLPLPTILGARDNEGHFVLGDLLVNARELDRRDLRAGKKSAKERETERSRRTMPPPH